MIYKKNTDGSFSKFTDFETDEFPVSEREAINMPSEALARRGLYIPKPCREAPLNQKMVSTRVEEIDGVVQYVAEWGPRQVSSKDVNLERRFRILKGSTFTLPSGDTIHVLGDEETRVSLASLAQAAAIRLQHGDTTHITPYRDAKNVVHKLTPQDVLDLWFHADSRRQGILLASWAIKDDPNGIPPDFNDDAYWPASPET